MTCRAAYACRARTGQSIPALAVTGLSVISPAMGHFAAVWQPVPQALAGRLILAHANGVLVVGRLGAGPLARHTRGPAALALSAYCALWFVLLHVPLVLASGAVADRCSGLGENATLIVGGLLVYADVTVACVPRWIRPLPGARAVRLGRVLFAPAAFRMSREHLAHPCGNADFPPQWLAHRMGWGYLVGFGYIATGLAILWRTLPRLASVVAASMMSALTALCWVSFVLEAPGSRLTWI